jgi:uncharacterized membrane protein
MKYSYTMPTVGGKAVGARYLIGMLLFGFSFVYSLVYNLILGAVSTISYRVGDLKNQLILLAVACLVFGIFLPLAFHFRTGRSVSAIAIGLLAVSYMGMGLAVMLGVDNGVNPWELMKKAESLQNWGLLIGLPAAAVTIAISFLCSCRIYERREKA